MNCPKCGAENREGSNFCRYCSSRLLPSGQAPNSGYVPSVPPPEATDFRSAYTPPETYQEPPAPPVYNPPPPAAWGQLVCPRCGNASVKKGGTPAWAIVLAVLLVPFTCFFSLFFLLVKGPHRCLSCGQTFK